MLFDCGEGTQRQIRLAGVSLFKVNYIFISHLHADHLLGLFGVIQTMGFLGKTDQLTIVGPKGIKRYINFATDWDFSSISYPINIIELTKDKKVIDNPDFTIHAYSLKHRECPCFAYVFEEKTELNLNKNKLKKLGLYRDPRCKELKEKGKIKLGKKVIKLEDVTTRKRDPIKVVYCVDTNPIDKIIEFSKNATAMICESTFAESDKEKALEYGHMTTQDAARIAKLAKIDQLILTHFSQRYKDTKILEREARAIFKDTLVADELMQIEI